MANAKLSVTVTVKCSQCKVPIDFSAKEHVRGEIEVMSSPCDECLDIMFKEGLAEGKQQ